MILELKYIGVDEWHRPVYQDSNGKLFKDVNCGKAPVEICTVCGGFDGEPDTPIAHLKKYQGVEIKITGRENEPTHEEVFNYMLLSRLKMDCEYFLGFGNKSESQLWAKCVKEQIEKMRQLYNSFPDSKKPQFITLEEISNYEKLMTQ